MNIEKSSLNPGDLSYYHNQKEGDFDPNTGEIFLPGDKNFENKRIFFDTQKEEKKEGQKNPEKHLEEVVFAINNVSLKKESKNEEEQLRQLEERKQEARELILEMLNKVSSYIDSIEKTTSIKECLKDPESFVGSDSFKKAMEKSDELRQIAHNSLIDSINIVNRFIAKNFLKLNDEVLKKIEEAESKAGRLILDVQRIELPTNIVLPDGYNIYQRKDVTRWAMDIYRAIIQLKPELEMHQ